MLCNEKPIKIIVNMVAILNIKVIDASLVTVSTPGIIPVTFAVKIEA